MVHPLTGKPGGPPLAPRGPTFKRSLRYKNTFLSVTPRTIAPRPVLQRPLPITPAPVQNSSFVDWWKKNLPAVPANDTRVPAQQLLLFFPENERKYLVGYTFIWGTHRHTDFRRNRPETLRYVYHAQIVSYQKVPKHTNGLLHLKESDFWINPYYQVTAHKLDDPLPPTLRNLSQSPSKDFPNFAAKDKHVQALFTEFTQVGSIGLSFEENGASAGGLRLI